MKDLNRPSFRRAAWTGAALVFALTLLPATAFAGTDGDLFSRLLSRYGFGAALAGAFLGGLMTAGTGCVYPMIGITVSVFGANQSSRRRAVLLSTAFVHGIAAFYVPLGLIAGLSGGLFGKIAGNPWVLMFEALLMFAMALSMFGLFDISLPASLQTRLSTMGGLGVRGAFVVGLVLGPIAAPCATAPLAGILSYIFQSKNAFTGAASLYVYSLGLGLPFFLVGALAVGLPKPGRWMNLVKGVLGFVLVVAGFWYLRNLVSFIGHAPGKHGGTIAAVLAVVGFVAAVAVSMRSNNEKVEKVTKIAGYSLAALGTVWLLSAETAVSNGQCSPIQWQRELAPSLATARSQHRPMMIDFGATWCRACEELAHQTLPSAAVSCALSERNFISVKLYENEQNEDRFEQMQREWHVRSLPTVIILNAEGREVARVNEFITPERMVSMLRRVDEQTAAR
jgi:thiol:disulfide interchange protein DsbD